MANLPPDRMKEAPPFTYVGVNIFGPFHIKERRSTLKKYRIIFTCLCSRAVHLESVSSMDTDAFIQSLRRFVGRRGNRLLRCDNGTNFVGTRNKLLKALNEMDEQSVSNFLLCIGADFISWKSNTPHASNHGGLWERIILSTRAILNALTLTHGQSLNDESFLSTLQGRSKWSEEQRNIQIGDVVLVKDHNVNRNQWKLGIVKNVIPSNDNKIRTVWLTHYTRQWSSAKAIF